MSWLNCNYNIAAFTAFILTGVLFFRDIAAAPELNINRADLSIRRIGTRLLLGVANQSSCFRAKLLWQKSCFRVYGGVPI